MNLNFIWAVLEESSASLGDLAYPAMDQAAANLALAPGWFTWVAAINLFAPDSFTVAQFMRLFPYGLRQVNEERFASAVRQGYLIADQYGGFRATELGQNVAMHTVFQAANQAIARLRPMPEETLQRLVELVTRLANTALTTPAAPVPYITTHKRAAYERLGMRESLEGFVARCLELEGYRDDAYITNWQVHRIEGHAWELLDQLSIDGALTFDLLHEKTGRRNVTREIHTKDVKELIGRGWAKHDADLIQITAEGRQIRAEVEAQTERFFYLPWACLSETELEELASLACQLQHGLNPYGET